MEQRAVHFGAGSASIAIAGLLYATAAAVPTGGAQADIYSSDNFSLYGDFRIRMEQDWASQTAARVNRSDRLRNRIRARVGINYDPSPFFTFGVRGRSGSDDSHQSPHITVIDFENNDTGDADFNPDKWFLKGKYEGLSGWVGRESFPFWTQNELFWDEDVTPAGFAGTYQAKLGADETLALNAGMFALPVGMEEFSGTLQAGQLVGKTKIGGVQLTAAGGFYNFESDLGDPDAAFLQNGNGFREYEIWNLGAQGNFKVMDLPVSLGADFLTNIQGYHCQDTGTRNATPFGTGIGSGSAAGAATDELAFTAANCDQDTGWVAQLSVGQLKDKGDWLLGYYYAWIQTFAVNASYAQDDWIRWGSAVEATGSNMRGHEVRAAYAFGDGKNLMLRVYLVEEINTAQDGDRARLDFNYKF